MKRSSFNLDQQNLKVESRIVVALERISEAFRVLLWNESKENALSPIQIQILIFIHFHAFEQCKVGYLANEFNMTKATVSDSVKVLISKDLLQKQPDPNDTRSFTLSLTEHGQTVAKKASLFAFPIEQPIERLTPVQKTVMLNGLLNLIHDLNKTGIITVQRMCFTCANYTCDHGLHFCKLLNAPLAESEIRLDCPEHELVQDQ